ncbi:hypothetical protein C7M52_01443 [Mixta theicola]|nr:DUF3131 domain-containing protein [Mixta theicola]QHM75489.1 hypothetical protein C7M52_01443 [Mixta theicola]
MSTLKAGLIGARSYLTILIGFLIAFAIVLWVERQMPTRVETTEGVVLSKDFPPLPQSRELTFDEAVWARVAWQYFINNTQLNGLVNAEDKQPWFSLWHSGSYLLATISARQLNIISAQEFDQRIAAALTTLSELPLLPGQLPASAWDAQTLEPLSNESAPPVDMARLMVPLQILQWRYPQHAFAVSELLARWQLSGLLQAGAPQGASLPVNRWQLRDDDRRGSYGYRLYAALMLRTINTAASLAVSQPPDGVKMVEIDGISVPDEGLRTPWGKQPSLISLPYLLSGLELGFDARSGEIAWRIMQIQQQRSGESSRRPAISTDYAEQAPDFVHALPGAQPLPRSLQTDTARENDPPQASLTAHPLASTRSAFSWYALFRNTWSEEKRRLMLPMLEPGRGWKAGFNPDNSVNAHIDADTNAVVLESLNYIAHGQLLCLACLWTPAAEAPAPNQRVNAE